MLKSQLTVDRVNEGLSANFTRQGTKHCSFISASSAYSAGYEIASAHLYDDRIVVVTEQAFEGSCCRVSASLCLQLSDVQSAAPFGFGGAF